MATVCGRLTNQCCVGNYDNLIQLSLFVMYSHTPLEGAGGTKTLLTHGVAKFCRSEHPPPWFGCDLVQQFLWSYM